MVGDGFTWRSEEWEAWEGLNSHWNAQGKKGNALERSNSHWGFSIVGVVIETVMGARWFCSPAKSSVEQVVVVRVAESGFGAGSCRRVSGNGREGRRSCGWQRL